MSQSPVTEGEFPTGPELMLWRPGVNRRRLRWCAILRSLVRTIAATTIVVIGLVGLATHELSGTRAWLVIIVVIVIVGVCAVCTVVDYRCAEYDHQHRKCRPCTLEAVRGEFFYRVGEFREFAPVTVDSVHRIIAAVERVHSSSAAVWINVQQLHDVHQVAWDALYLLDRTRTLRNVLIDPRSAECEELRRVRSYLAEVDEAVDRVLTYLLQAELLVTSWERKLAELELMAQLRTELSRVPPETIAVCLQRAEAIPERIFAYITAARDVTHAGPFEWEARS